MKFKKHTLKNGLRIVLAPMHETETVTVMVMTGVGSRYETRKENGLAHFLEHMFFKGTEKRPTAMDISRELDAVGAEYNAYTGKDRTAYYAKVESRHWETALDVVSDIFLNAKLDQEEIDRERGPITQELNMYEDMPMRHIGDVWEEHLYGDHPLGWEIIGTKENISTFQRKDFIKYLNRGYVAGNVTIGVAGKMDEVQMKKEIMKRFKNIRTGEKPTFKKIVEKQTAPGILLKHKKTDQTHMLLGVRTYPMEHKDRYVLSVMATLLGGGMSSRLFMAVRERRGLAYSVHTSGENYHDAGYLATQCGVEHENLEKTVEVILDEYKRMTLEMVDDDELCKAKEYIKGKMAMGFEGSDDVVEYVVTQETIYGKITTIEEKRKYIDKVTALDVMRVAKDIFQNKKLNLVVIGPHTPKAELSRMLNIE